MFNLKTDSDNLKEYMSDDLLNENNKFEIVVTDSDIFEPAEEELQIETDSVFESQRITKLKEAVVF